MRTPRTPHDITLQCPRCGTWFVSATMDAARVVGRPSTDFHCRVDGPDPIAYRVHVCAGCDFAGLADDFASDEIAAASAASRGDACVATSIALAGSQKYEAAAATAERRGDGPSAVADLLLHAAWCCVGEQDREAERFFRRRAAWAFERALARYDDVPSGQRAELTYLVGELWRRSDDAERARQWLDRVAGEVVDDEQDWLVTLARQQRDAPREWLC